MGRSGDDGDIDDRQRSEGGVGESVSVYKHISQELLK